MESPVPDALKSFLQRLCKHLFEEGDRPDSAYLGWSGSADNKRDSGSDSDPTHHHPHHHFDAQSRTSELPMGRRRRDGEDSAWYQEGDQHRHELRISFERAFRPFIASRVVEIPRACGQRLRDAAVPQQQIPNSEFPRSLQALIVSLKSWRGRLSRAIACLP